MSDDDATLPKRRPNISGGAKLAAGRGELPALEITTVWSTAEIYLHGAQITQFRKNGEPPLLFLSQCSRFVGSQPIRGGIPIIFPWFGKPADRPNQHGFARVTDWRVVGNSLGADDTVEVRLAMDVSENRHASYPCAIEYVVTIGEALSAELIVTNRAPEDLVFENCLHTYFNVGDIASVGIGGLRGLEYLDQVEGFARKRETEAELRIAAEVDRVYLNARDTVRIMDRSLGRTILIEKEGSASTVVWNPWVEKAKALPDFGDDEFQRMVCVESGNVGLNRITLPEAGTARLKVRLSSMEL